MLGMKTEDRGLMIEVGSGWNWNRNDLKRQREAKYG
jgi:hypothetical protein